MADPKVKVTMNRHALADLVLFAPREKLEACFRQFDRTVKRLGVPVTGRAIKRVPRGVGQHPGLHDVMRWLDSLTAEKEDEADVKFLFRLYNACLSRDPDLPERVKKQEEALH